MHADSIRSVASTSPSDHAGNGGSDAGPSYRALGGEVSPPQRPNHCDTGRVGSYVTGSTLNREVSDRRQTCVPQTNEKPRMLSNIVPSGCSAVRTSNLGNSAGSSSELSAVASSFVSAYHHRSRDPSCRTGHAGRLAPGGWCDHAFSAGSHPGEVLPPPSKVRARCRYRHRVSPDHRSTTEGQHMLAHPCPPLHRASHRDGRDGFCWFTA